MELGLMVEPQVGGTYARLLELAQWAEAQGLDAFARSDHYLDMDRSDHATDSFTTLAGLARETSSVQLLPLVAPLTFHHPSRLAKAAATLDEMSGGRFALGVGTGWMESEHEAFGLALPDLNERFSRLYETLAYLRAAFNTPGGFDGRHYHLDAIDVLPRPQHLPIVVGGGGPKKTPTLAGQFADEYNLFTTDRESLDARRDVLHAAAEAAGRDPAAIKISFATPVFAAATTAASDLIIEERAAKTDRTPAEYVEMIDGRNFLHGTPDQAAAVMARISDMGIDRLYLQMYSHLDEVDTALLEEILVEYRDGD